MNRQHLIFDLGGTISDPALGIARSLNYALTAFGFDAVPEDSVSKYIGPPVDDTFCRLAEPDDRMGAAIFDTDTGILQGHAALRQFFEEGGRRRPNELVRWHREPGRFLYDNHRLVWEYPREAPGGYQIEITEVMDLADGLIQHHRIYWGWFGIQQLIRSALSRHGSA